jgi:hypothetical protein
MAVILQARPTRNQSARKRIIGLSGGPPGTEAIGFEIAAQVGREVAAVIT